MKAIMTKEIQQNLLGQKGIKSKERGIQFLTVYNWHFLIEVLGTNCRGSIHDKSKFLKFIVVQTKTFFKVLELE